MSIKFIIKKVLFIGLWISIGGSIVTLLVAAVSKQTKELCSGFEITLNSEQNNFFIDRKQVESIIFSINGRGINGKKIALIKLHQLEDSLEKNNWVQNAEIWVDNQNMLHVSIVERVPIARIFTMNGDSYYIDSSLKTMQLSENMNVKIPVFTGFTNAKLLSTKDSLSLVGIKKIANFINGNNFWMNQISQIDIDSSGNFVMVPTIGNHIVKFGNAENLDKKFEKLFAFYQQVLAKTGFDIYKLVDVQLANQIIGTKRGVTNGVVDSLQWRNHIEQMMMQMRGDTISVSEKLNSQIITQ